MRLPSATFALRTSTVFDTPLCVTSYRRLSQFCYRSSHQSQNGAIAVGFTDLNTLFLRKRDDSFKNLMDGTVDLFVPDGASLKLLLARKGVPVEESLSGNRFMMLCCLRSPEKVRHYILGGTPAELDHLIRALKRRNPALSIAGSHHGDFGAGDEADIVTSIARCTPDIVWICLPTPHQETFLNRWKNRLPSCVSVLVGASFDFHRAVGPAERKAYRATTPYVRRALVLSRRALRRYLNLRAFLWVVGRQLPELRPEFAASPIAHWVREPQAFWHARNQIGFAFACWRHRMRHWTRRAAKRALDVVGASALIVLFSPILLATALVIWLGDERPILFAQRRVGRHGRVFKLWKFRTMRRDAELIEAKAQEHKIDDSEECFVAPHDDSVLKLRRVLLLHSRSVKYPRDPRIIRFGRLIRKGSIDELPQLYHIVRGDMSLVGPRPFVTYEVAEYSPRHLIRHKAKPGLTGPWQISDRNKLTFDESIGLDLLYIKKQSLWLDLKLLLQTIPAAFKNRGGE
jgi:exopolysaccharide biosynthesis WecB/TagA/CpsF family protein